MSADAAKLPPFKPLPFKAPDIEVRRGENGVVYLSSRTPLPAPPRSIPHVLDEQAAQNPDRPWMKQRLPNHGDWRQVTYGEGAKITRSLAQALLDRGLGPDAPLMILSGNSIEHGLMSLAAQRIGAPATPISMAYSTMSTDFAKLKHCFNAVKPKAIFVRPRAAALPAQRGVRRRPGLRRPRHLGRGAGGGVVRRLGRDG
jgi:feruloyl-CoA synthase